MKRTPPRWLGWLWRGSDAELGDVLEEYSAGRGALWLLRQAISTRRPAYIPERRPPMFANLWSDLRYAARGLRHNPGFTAAAVLAIALGIGINTGIFSVLNGLALRELPVPGPAELVSIHRDLQGKPRRLVHGTGTMVTTEEYRAYRDGARTLSGLMAYAPFWEMTLGGDEPRRVNGDLVTCNYFDVLRLRPALGPGFNADNCSDAMPTRVVMLGYELWRDRFGSDPGIAGRSIILNRQSFRVAGVAPEGFRGVEVVPAAFFAPVATQPLLWNSDYFSQPDTSWLQMMGRRRDGVSVDQVRADLRVIAGQIDAQEPGRRSAILVGRATPFSMPEVRTGILAVAGVILAAFGLVLLIACANVANLMLARAAGRTKEIVVRLAVGASRGRLIRQLLAESLLIALAGGALGSALALWTFRGLTAAVLSSLPAPAPQIRFDAVPDLRVFGFALALAFATGVLFGLLPALQASKPDLASGMKADGSGSGRRTGGLLRGALVAVQVAVCMVLMVAAGLLLKGLYAAQTVEPGFEYRNVASVTYDLRGSGYSEEAAGRFQAAFLDAVRAIPGVTAAAQADMTPLSPGETAGMFAPGAGLSVRRVQFNVVSPEYFSVIGTPVVLGRNFDPGSDSGYGSVIVTESTARQFWPRENPVGKAIEMGRGPRQPPLQIPVVGVVRDAQITQVGRESEPYLYFAPAPRNQVELGMVVRSETNFADTAAAIRARALDLDPNLVVNVAPLEDNLDFWRTLARLVTGLSGSLGGLALVLAAVGVYGVVSYAVSRRLREVGIRMVLGATAGDVRGLVFRQALRPVAVGAAVGLAAAAGVSRVLESVLFGVSALDAMAFVGAPVFLLAVALAAAWIPARRAMRVDPMVTLRYE